jgi:outer membrane protein TolC
MKILGFLKGCRLYGAYLGVFIGMALGQIVSPSVAATGVIEDDSPSEATSVISRNAVTLTLAEVMALSLAHHPRLEAIAQEREASNGSLRQAKTLANPMLTIMDENLGNDRLAEAGDRAISLQVGQLIELGGKRSARIAVADQARLLAAIYRHACGANAFGFGAGFSRCCRSNDGSCC